MSDDAFLTGVRLYNDGAFFEAHGEPFNEAGWRRIVDEHGGKLPLRIRAVAEGAVGTVAGFLAMLCCGC